MNRIGGRAFARECNVVVAAILIAGITAASSRAHAEDPPPAAAAPDHTGAAPAPSRASFMAREVGAGVGGIFLSGAAGLATTVVVFKLIFHPSNDCGDMCGLGEALLSAGVGGLTLAGGYLVGIPSFVWLAGDGREGRGHLGAAILGSLAGLAVDAGITAIAAKAGLFSSSSSDALGATYYIAMFLVPVAASAIGFELSVHDEAPTPTAGAKALSVTPFIAPLSEHGGIGAGLAGRF